MLDHATTTTQLQQQRHMQGAIAEARRHMARWEALAEKLLSVGNFTDAQSALRNADYWRKRGRYYRQELRAAQVGFQRERALATDLLDNQLELERDTVRATAHSPQSASAPDPGSALGTRRTSRRSRAYALIVS